MFVTFIVTEYFLKWYGDVLSCTYHPLICTGWAKKTGPFLNVDNFAMVSGRKACICQKFANFI